MKYKVSFFIFIIFLDYFLKMFSQFSILHNLLDTRKNLLFFKIPEVHVPTSVSAKFTTFDLNSKIFYTCKANLIMFFLNLLKITF